MQLDPDNNLLDYFTDVEHLRGVFKEYIAAASLPKRVIAIHGVGGVGKSSLLRIFRLHAKSVQIPVALTSAEESKSAVDVLSNWASDLKAAGVSLNNFQKTLVHYKAIQAKVEDQAKRAQEARKKIAEKVGTAVAKAIIGAAISLIPGGQLVDVLGGIGLDAFVDWLSGFLTKPDIDLLLDPTKTLSEYFLEDIAKSARKHRIVLILDTFEQMSALNDWVCSMAMKLDENILLVIASREMINWDRQWDGWLAHIQIEELEPMTKEDMRELARRYYATMIGGEPDPKQIEAIIAFARGLPMLVTTAVRLWVKYFQAFDVEEHKVEVYGDVAKRLREGVPSELLPILEASAIVRWFDKPILRAITKLEDINSAYEEIRRFPFVKSRKEGLSLHDSVREIIDDTLYVEDPDHHKELHERAAKYFEKLSKKISSEEIEKIELERLYHRVLADENKGIRLFQESAEELTRYKLVSRLRALVNDVNTYTLKYENAVLWRKYYNARLAYLEGHLLQADEVYQGIIDKRPLDQKLYAYAICDWAPNLRNRAQLDLSIQWLERGLADIPLDPKMALGLIQLAVSLRRKGHYERSNAVFDRVIKFYNDLGDKFGLIVALGELKVHYLHQGAIKRAASVKEQMTNEFFSLNRQPPSLKIDVLSGALYWAWFGWLKRSEIELREVYDILQQLDLVDVIGVTRDLGYVLGFEDRFDESEEYFRVSAALTEKIGGGSVNFIRAITLGFWGAVQLRQGKMDIAQMNLLRSLELKKVSMNVKADQEVCLWLGTSYEMQSMIRHSGSEFEKLIIAESYYQQVYDLRWTGRRYFESSALTSLLRVKQAQADFGAIPPLLSEAEQLAQQYEYNDHLASLRLTQGHLAWENGNRDDVLDCYQKAMVYALRYNRFLLDELLSGRPQGTPLRPIIPYCLEHEEDGRDILIALYDWWVSGSNDIGSPRPDTISPIPEGLPLLEAERIARDREPGDGSEREGVKKQIERVL